jgi:hypothetical protein
VGSQRIRGAILQLFNGAQVHVCTPASLMNINYSHRTNVSPIHNRDRQFLTRSTRINGIHKSMKGPTDAESFDLYLALIDDHGLENDFQV